MFDLRAEFISDLARRLHTAGVSASRLEGAVRNTAHALDVTCEIWATPTGLLLSLGDGSAEGAQVTRVLRLEPGNVDLSALVALNDIADRVIGGTMDVREAVAALRGLDRPATGSVRLTTMLGFGLAAAAIAGLLRTGWLDVVVAGALGLVIGALAIESRANPHLSAAFEAVAALLATVAVSAFAHFVAPLSVQTVVIAALIVLMPGLTLTTAVTELATQQLVAGTARFAGAMVTFFKLIFGSVAGAQLVSALGWASPITPAAALPTLVEPIAAIAAAFSFAILFRAPGRDVPLVIASALFGYVLTRAFGIWVVSTDASAFAAPVFGASLAVAAISNAYGRATRRPGELVRVPGIMLMVPGSVGFRGLASIMARDYTLGLDTGVAVLSALIALMAGLLFGSLLIPPRRYL